MVSHWMPRFFAFYIAEHFEEQMFLHADADDSPKDMYMKMGFEVVDSLFEYCKTW